MPLHIENLKVVIHNIALFFNKYPLVQSACQIVLDYFLLASKFLHIYSCIKNVWHNINAFHP